MTGNKESKSVWLVITATIVLFCFGLPTMAEIDDLDLRTPYGLGSYGADSDPDPEANPQETYDDDQEFFTSIDKSREQQPKVQRYATASAKYGGGTGDPNDPYQIHTAAQMDAIGMDPNDWGSHFILMADIDMSAYTYPTALIAPDTDNTIYNSTFEGVPFTGVFDGGGRVILNLTINTLGADNYYIGLFGLIDTGGEVKNLGMENVSVIGGNSTRYLGGLVGYNYGSITNCYAAGSVSGDKYIGGLGGINQGSVSNCYATGTVNGTGWNIGGLWGRNATAGIISDSYSTGDVTGDDDTTTNGGLCGINFGTVSQSYATGSVTGNSRLGGLAGMNQYGTINNSYATGSVTGGDNSTLLGGLCGENTGGIGNCFATGLITGGIDSEDLGGLCGVNTAIVYHSFWDTLTSQITTSEGGVGKTSLEMKDINTYAGWGDNIWTIDSGNDYPHLAWENQAGIPIIDSPRTYSGGAGIVDDPYLIAEPNDLRTFGTHSVDWDKHYKLVNDIDLSGLVINEYLVAEFRGVFDGDGYSISNLTIDTLGSDSDYLGLFGNIIGEPAQVKNLGLESVSVTSGIDSWNVGGLCGRNTGAISNCYITGTVSGYRAVGGLCGINYGTISNCHSDDLVNGGQNVGGLCGYNGSTISNCEASGSITGGVDSDSVGGLCGYNGSTISNCYSEGSVSGDYRVGGLCGWSWGTVSDCYAIGPVTGIYRLGGLCGQNGRTITNCYSEGSVTGKVDSDLAGGLCGWNFDTISNCYSTGTVSCTGSYLGGLCGRSWGIVYHCFWDTQTSGVPSSAGGIGKTPAEMMDINTYAGWGDNVWTIDDGNDYPHLAWENQPGVPIVDSIRTYSGGSGTIGEPYLIAEPNDLIILSIYSDDWDKHFKLIANIEMTSFTFNTAVISIFTGTFEGSDHKILNLTIDTLGIDDSYLGLFGRIDADCEVRNLCLENVSVIGGNSSENLGGLCGHNYGTIAQCSITGSISGGTESRYLGGVAGYNDGTISHCDTNGSVSGGENSDYLGGLCGYTDDGTISDCYASGIVTGDAYLGGLCGKRYKGTISNCSASVSVTGGDNSYKLGGLFGENQGMLSNCNASGIVSAGDNSGNLGGLCGYTQSTISSCYATGTVSGGNNSEYIGGLCGNNNRGRVSYCYATGSVSGGNESSSIGGLFGQNNRGPVSFCYATGSVTAGNDSEELGGLCGTFLYTSLDYCYATGSVSGGTNAYGLGGLCGNKYGGPISNCYASGNVIGGDNSRRLGGLFGGSFIGSTITNCYSVGSITAGTGSRDLGGLFGSNDSSISNYCYWDINTSGMDTSDGGEGKTTYEMMQWATFTNWDFLGESANGTDDIWRMCEDNIRYPKLAWEFLDTDYACPDGVDNLDFAVFARAWASTSADGHWNPACNLYVDDRIDLYDLLAFCESWLYPIDYDLLAHWKLDETSGTMAHDSGRYGLNGSLQGDAVWTAGYIDNAVSLDGDGDYIDLGSSSRLKPPLPITVAAWIELDQVGTFQAIINTDKKDYDGEHRLYGSQLMVWNTGQLSISFGDGQPNPPNQLEGGIRLLKGTTAMQPGTWYHVAAVIRGPEDMSLYVNGQDDGGTFIGTGGGIAYSDGTSEIGCRSGNILFFSGDIDDVRIYSRALSESEIQTLASN